MYNTQTNRNNKEAEERKGRMNVPNSSIPNTPIPNSPPVPTSPRENNNNNNAKASR